MDLHTLSNSPTDESPTETTYISATNQSNNEVAFYEGARPAEPSATDCTEVITASLSSNEHANLTRSVTARIRIAVAKTVIVADLTTEHSLSKQEPH
jgi:hypothetical protein